MGNKSSSAAQPQTEAKSYHDLAAADIDQQTVDFKTLDGKVVLVVNVASRCGLTATNYKELVEIQDKYADQGLIVHAFPCNQFGNQEPGDNEEIKRFAAARRFKGLLMDKICVNGPKSSPVFSFLKVASGDSSPIQWNFTKFLVRRDGTVYGRFGPRTNPRELEPHIQECLKLTAG